MLPAGAVAGWASHPLENAAFPRRTPCSDTGRAARRCASRWPSEAMEDVRAGAKPRLTHRDLCRRSRDPVTERQSRRRFVATARDHEKAEAHGQRGEDTKGGAYPQSISSVTTLHRRPVSVRVSRHFRWLGPSLLQLVTQHVHHRHSAARNAASLCNFRLQAYSTSGAGPRLNAK